MYAATRKLIAARTKHVKYPLSTARVKQLGGGTFGDCYENSHRGIDRKNKIQIVSGWLVGRYDPFSCSTEITSHFWNVRNGTDMIDFTPIPYPDMEYVVDMDFIAFGQKNYDTYSSMVPSSLLLKNDKFQLVSGDHSTGLRFHEVDELTNENLFQAFRI